MNNTSLNIRTTYHTVIADLTSPIAVYARLRDRYSRALLLESSDFHGADDCRSFICCDPLAEFKIENGELHLSYLNEKQPPKPIKHATGFSEELSIFLNSFKIESSALPKGVVNGAFGYAAWDYRAYGDPHIYQKTGPNLRYSSGKLLSLSVCAGL